MSDQTFMLVFFLFLTVVSGGVAYMDIWTKKQNKIIENMTPSEDIDELKGKHAKEIADLKERVATLEKIVTDGTFDLKQEIKKLDAA